MTKCERFCNGHCTTSDCPNIQCDMADDEYGYGIAEDMGLKRIKCGDCYYDDKRCTCEDCYLRGGEYCPNVGSDDDAAD